MSMDQLGSFRGSDLKPVQAGTVTELKSKRTQAGLNSKPKRTKPGSKAKPARNKTGTDPKPDLNQTESAAEQHSNPLEMLPEPDQNACDLETILRSFLIASRSRSSQPLVDSALKSIRDGIGAQTIGEVQRASVIYLYRLLYGDFPKSKGGGRQK